jgi:hypothetical protein
MNTLVGDLTSETISFIYKECEKDKNKKRLSIILDNVTEFILKKIQPYLYTIMAILILLFLINFFQFYYYIKLFILNNNKSISDVDKLILI